MFFENKELMQISEWEWECIIDKRKENQELLHIQEVMILRAINNLLSYSTLGNAYDKISEIRGMQKMRYITLFNEALNRKKEGVKVE